MAFTAQVAYPRMPPEPAKLPANAIFHGAFNEAMERDSPEWQIDPSRSSPLDPPGEEMTWRRGNSRVTVRYARYSSADDAAAWLERYRAVIPIGLPKVEEFADEAYGNGGTTIFRRGVYAFRVSAWEPPTKPRPAELFVLGVHVNRYAALFLAAADTVLRGK